jgi:hypothetical protein
MNAHPKRLRTVVLAAAAALILGAPAVPVLRNAEHRKLIDFLRAH